MRGTASTAKPFPGPHLQRIRSSEVAADERFDYWRSLFPGVDMQPLCSPRTFGSETMFCASDDGTLFSHVRSDPTATRFREGGDQHLMISLITHGAVRVRHGSRHEALVDATTGFTIHDCAKPSFAESFAGHQGLHLSIPRALAISVLEERAGTARAPLRRMAPSPLGEVLKANMLALARNADQLEPRLLARIMGSVSELAMAYLAQSAPPPDRLCEEAADDYLFMAARRYMDAHRASSSLTADSVAHAVGCSRAHLYRQFARHGVSVAGYLRETRLIMGRLMLRQQGLDIGDIALRCGYGDLPAFSKAFRRRFGISPREWRSGGRQP